MKTELISALSIAGSDSGGGAGIQADLNTFLSCGVFGTTAITALTAQNTKGVSAVQALLPELVAAQIDAVVEDIAPGAVKTGMLANRDIIRLVARKAQKGQLPNLVVDPVMVATSGDRLLEPEAETALLKELIPWARVITPNLAEAEVLVGFSVRDDEKMLEAAECLLDLGAGVVIIKGGHRDGLADDLYLDGNGPQWLRSSRLTEEELHGTGCSFSAALAAGLALGLKTLAAARAAKAFISAGIVERRHPGQGAAVINWATGGIAFNQEITR